MTPNALKSPLRIPGGKTRAVKTIGRLIPHCAEWREPFLGGGSMSLYVSRSYPDVKIWVNDLYYPLYNFWINLQSNGERLSDTLLDIKDSIGSNQEAHQELFEACKYGMKDEDSFDAAVSFYVLNKCSYSGLTENSAFSATASKNNFTRQNIRKLKEYSEIIRNWKITNLDYSKVMLRSGKNVFLFLDPPYDIDDYLYGTNKELHRFFDHDRFAHTVDSCKHQFVLTYNINDFIERRYKQYQQRRYPLTYGMVHRGNENRKTELVISNF
jgi:DNA adenine methylase